MTQVVPTHNSSVCTFLEVNESANPATVVSSAAAVIAEGAFYNLDAPVKRMCAMHVPIPFSPPLEDVTVPTEQTVFEAARALCG